MINLGSVIIVTSLIAVGAAAMPMRTDAECTLGSKFMEKSSCSYNHTQYCQFEFEMGRCLACDPLTCDVLERVCLFDYDDNSSLELNPSLGKLHIKLPPPTSCQELEERMCGAMNREGMFCSRCKPSYGPAPHSSTVKCFECKDDGSARLWLLYLTLELLPSTAFFLAVIFFNIRTTAPPYTAFVFVSQFFALLYKVQPFIRLNLNLRINNTLLRGVLTLSSFWNLDFFQHAVPPFCISSRLTDLHVLLLNYVSALYPLLLVILTLGLIELHARNFHPLVLLWKPVHKYFACCRRKIDPKSSVIAASATFISLSFSKLLITAILSKTFANISWKGERFRGLYDANIQCNATAECVKQLLSTSYFLPLTILFLVAHVPTLLLLLYPIKPFRRFLACCCSSKFHAINVFVDTFQGHYKDGTTGSRDYRAASSISFLLRTLLCTVMTMNHYHYGIQTFSSSYTNLAFLLVIASLFYGVVQPCKKKYMNLIECVIYFAAGWMLLTLGSAHAKGHKSAQIFSIAQLYISLIILVLPSAVLLLLSISKILSCLCCFRRRKRIDFTVPDSLVSREEELPDRIRNPQDYESLN